MLGAVATAIVLGGAAALIVPAIDEGKDKAAAKERRERASRVRAETARLREEQRPRRGRASKNAPFPAVIDALERSITRDARGRLEDPIRFTTCSPSGLTRRAPNPRFAIYKCLAVTGESSTERGLPLQTGYPFVARVTRRSHRYAWCKQNPVAGEKAGEAFARVPLSPECAGPLAEVL